MAAQGSRTRCCQLDSPCWTKRILGTCRRDLRLSVLLEKDGKVTATPCPNENYSHTTCVIVFSCLSGSVQKVTGFSVPSNQINTKCVESILWWIPRNNKSVTGWFFSHRHISRRSDLRELMHLMGILQFQWIVQKVDR